MVLDDAERKQIENEMIFRRINEKVGFDLDALNAQHKVEGNDDLISDEHLLLMFKCECSDEDCDVRVPLQLNTYKELHLNRDTFIVKTNHQIDKIENVLRKEKGYNVVKKKNSTPEPGDKLNHTTVDNSRV